MGNERGTRTSGTASTTTTAATATTTSSYTCREPASTGQEDTRTWRTSAAIVAAAAGYTTAVASGAKSKFFYAVQSLVIVHQLGFSPKINYRLCNSRRRLGLVVHHQRQLMGQTLRKGQTYNNKQGATQQHRATTQTKQGASHGAVLLWEATKRRVSNEGMSFAISTNS